MMTVELSNIQIGMMTGVDNVNLGFGVAAMTGDGRACKSWTSEPFSCFIPTSFSSSDMARRLVWNVWTVGWGWGDGMVGGNKEPKGD